MDDPHRHTWPGGRCPDGQYVPEPPRRPAAPTGWYERARFIAVLVVALAAAVIGALR